jgi:signal transduction histidine kinase
VLLLTQNSKANPIDSLSKLIQNTDSISQVSVWIQHQRNLANEYLNEGNYPAVLKHYETALSAAQRNNLKKQTHEIIIQIAEVFYRQSKHDISLSYLKKIEAEIDPNDKTLRALTFRFLGINKVYTGDYAEAYKYQIQALNLFQELKDTANIARIEYGIATNFFFQKQYDNSIEYYKKALQTGIAVKNKQIIYGSYGALGSLSERLGRYKEALDYHAESLERSKQNNDKASIGWILFNIGSVLGKLGDNQKMLNTLKEAEKISLEIDDSGLRTEVWVALANTYNKLNKPDIALYYLQKSYELAARDNARSLIVDIFRYKANAYFLKNDLKKYNEYIEKHIGLKDSLFNDNLAEEMAGLKKNYSLLQLEKENEVSLLKKDKEIQQVKSNFNIGVFVAIFIVIALLLLLMYMRNKSEKEKNLLLEIKNKEILRQNEILAMSNRDLEQYAYIISHDLKEPLRNISSFTNLLNRRLKNMLTPDTQQFMDFILKGTQQMHDLLHDLLLYSKISRQKSNIENIDTNIFLKEILDHFATEIANNQATIITENLPSINFDKAQLKNIFTQLLSNALKFRSENPLKIEIKQVENIENHVVSFTDNGIGIDERYFEKIFIIFQRIHDRGKYSGTSMGLATCKKILEQHGGHIWVTSKLGEGATFYIQIPKICVA